MMNDRYGDYEGDGELCVCGHPDTIHGDMTGECMECGDTFRPAEDPDGYYAYGPSDFLEGSMPGAAQ